MAEESQLTGTPTVATTLDISWTSPGNLTADDDNDASTVITLNTPPFESDVLLCKPASTWSFSDDVHIDSIVVEWRDMTNNASNPLIAGASRTRMRQPDALPTWYDLYDPGFDWTPGISIYSLQTASGAILDDLGKEVAAFSNDWWRYTWTAADVKDADFGCEISRTGETGETITTTVDCIVFRIFYHSGFPTPLQRYPRTWASPNRIFFRYSNETYAITAQARITSGPTETCVIVVQKKADPSKGTWSVLDFANGPVIDNTGSQTSPSNDDFWSLAHVVDGTTLHIVWSEATSTFSQSIRYCTFNLSTGTWGTPTTLVSAIDTAYSGGQWLSMEVYSSSEIMVAYQGDTDKIMGGDKGRVDYARYNGTSWSAGNALDAAGDVHYGSPNLCKASATNEYHFTWLRETSTANDPNTSWSDIQGRTWEGGALNGTTNTQAFTISATIPTQYLSKHLVRKSSTEILLFIMNSSGQIVTWNCQETGANSIITFDGVANGTSSLSSTIVVNDKNAEFSIVYDSSRDRFWMAFIDGNYDIFLTYSDDDGATWATQEEIFPLPTGYPNLRHIGLHQYTSHQGEVLAYAYTSGLKSLYYNEYSLENPFLPYYGQVNDARKRSTLLRM